MFASMTKFLSYLGINVFCNILTISITIATTIFMRQQKNLHNQHINLSPVHIPSFIKLASIIFESSWDPYAFAVLPYSNHKFHVTVKNK